MTQYDYKVVPTPRRINRVKGVKSVPELFALTLAEAINEQARQGWEYLRAEQLPAEDPAGWFRRARETEQTVLIFRRVRESVGPRLAAIVASEAAASELRSPPEIAPEPRRAENGRPLAERLHPGLRRGGPTRVEPRPELRSESRPELRPEPSRVEPRIGPRAEPRTGGTPGGPASTPLRPVPKLGPADKP